VNGIRNFNKNRLKYGDSGVFVSETIKLCCYKINNRLRSLPSLREGRGTAAAVDEYALYFFKQFDKSPFIAFIPRCCFPYINAVLTEDIVTRS
ncbi:MAG: hypothetical protein IJY04_05720, partial [Clostridia bacterium]|nr:hypothetical protein [Clostridia bacterium]